MYPLIEPSLNEINKQLQKFKNIDDIKFDGQKPVYVYIIKTSDQMSDKEGTGLTPLCLLFISYILLISLFLYFVCRSFLYLYLHRNLRISSQNHRMYHRFQMISTGSIPVFLFVFCLISNFILTIFIVILQTV